MNTDGSIDSLFGPEAPSGKEHNWVKTIPGKRWYLILSLYDLKDSVNFESWSPGEIEEVDMLI